MRHQKIRFRALALTVALGVLATACGGEGAEETTTAPGPDNSAIEASAEEFLDGFYSYDPSAIEPLLEGAEDPAFWLYYQGWAEGANYTIIDRQPCVAQGPTHVKCDVTVEDDFAKTLGYDFNVTDTFSIFFSDGESISSMTVLSDDPDLQDAQGWVRANLPDLIAEPCDKMWNGGPAQECAVAMVEGLAAYVESGDYSG